MSLHFQKVHGLGNDFIFLDLRDLPDLMSPPLAERLCHRNLGIGGDGVLAFTGSVREPTMTIWNSDGTIPEMCGNGIRCFVMELVRRFEVVDNPIIVRTGAGPLACRWDDLGSAGFMVEVDMGAGVSDGADVDLAELPGLGDAAVPPRSLLGQRISTGNPHVIFYDRFTDEEIRAWGPPATASATFPSGANVEFAEVTAPGRVRLTVHERGAGFTLACGTGACATVAAGVRSGFLKSDVPVEVTLPGGVMKIVHRSKDGHLIMTGPAVEVYEGVVDSSLLQTDS